jgi:hypothetical protein
MFRDRRRLRRWATQMLLVWLLGIGTGMAHACVLGLADHHHDDTSLAVTHTDSVRPHGHSGSPPAGDDRANCLDFCEKSAVTAPSLKSKLDQGGNCQLTGILPSPSPLLTGWVTATPALLGGAIPRLGGPPPRIAFQRLTL